MIVHSKFNNFNNIDLSTSFQKTSQEIFFKEKSAAYIDDTLVPINIKKSVTATSVISDSGNYIDTALNFWNINGVTKSRKFIKNLNICCEKISSDFEFICDEGRIYKVENSSNSNQIYFRLGVSGNNLNSVAFYSDECTTRTYTTFDSDGNARSLFIVVGHATDDKYYFFAISNIYADRIQFTKCSDTQISAVTAENGGISFTVGGVRFLFYDGFSTASSSQLNFKIPVCYIHSYLPLNQQNDVEFTEFAIEEFYRLAQEIGGIKRYALIPEKVLSQKNRFTNRNKSYVGYAFRTHISFDVYGNLIDSQNINTNFCGDNYSVYITPVEDITLALFDCEKAMYLRAGYGEDLKTENLTDTEKEDRQNMKGFINASLFFPKQILDHLLNAWSDNYNSFISYTAMYNGEEINAFSPFNVINYFIFGNSAGVGTLCNPINGESVVSGYSTDVLLESDITNEGVSNFVITKRTSQTRTFHLPLFYEKNKYQFVAFYPDYIYCCIQKWNNYVPDKYWTDFIRYIGEAQVDDNGGFVKAQTQASTSVSPTRYGYFNVITDNLLNFIAINCSLTSLSQPILITPIYDKEPIISFIDDSRAVDGKAVFVKYNNSSLLFYISSKQTDFKLWFYNNEIAVCNALDKNNAYDIKEDVFFTMHNGFVAVATENIAYNTTNILTELPSLPLLQTIRTRKNYNNDAVYIGAAVNPFPYSNTSKEVSSLLYPFKSNYKTIKTGTSNVALFVSEQASNATDLSVLFKTILNSNGAYTVLEESQYPQIPRVVSPLYSIQSKQSPFVAYNTFFNYSLLLDKREVSIALFGNPFLALSGYDYSFSIRGIFFVAKDGRLYSSSSENLANTTYVTNVSGMDFVGATLENALFWCKETGGLYLFDGSISLSYFTEFISATTPKSWIRTSTRDIIIQRNDDLLIINDHYSVYDKSFGRIENVVDFGIIKQPNPPGSQKEVFSYDIQNEHFMTKPIEITTSYIGNGFNTLSTFRNVYFYGYAPTDGTNGRQWYLDIGGYAFVDNKEISIFGNRGSAGGDACWRYRSTGRAHIFNNEYFITSKTIDVGDVAPSGQVYFVVRLPVKTASMIRLCINTTLRLSDIAIEYDEAGIQIQQQ